MLYTDNIFNVSFNTSSAEEFLSRNASALFIAFWISFLSSASSAGRAPPLCSAAIVCRSYGCIIHNFSSLSTGFPVYATSCMLSANFCIFHNFPKYFCLFSPLFCAFCQELVENWPLHCLDEKTAFFLCPCRSCWQPIFIFSIFYSWQANVFRIAIKRKGAEWSSFGVYCRTS